MYRRHTALGAILAAGLVLAGCSSSPAPSSGGGKVVLKFWGVAENTDKASDAIIKKFEQTHPNIDVQWTGYPEDQIDTKINTALAAGAPPDISGPSRNWMRAGR